MQKRILTGERTTGKLHLGHYVGSLKNRVALQDTYDTYVLLADVQAMTTHFESPALIRESVLDVALDNLSVGLDPEKVILVQQSHVAAIAELTVFYSMITTVNTLRHNPTIKSEMAQYGTKELTYGFLGYPVSQAADITCVHADLVPVGEDQLPHIEQTHRIVRKFNSLYGDVLKRPEALLSDVPRLPGLDGNSKMGKSLGNAIYLSDAPDVVATKVRSAVTDPSRISLKDKGHPERCVVATYHNVFNPLEAPDISARCSGATLGCVACKGRLTEVLNTLLEPIRIRRSHYENRVDDVVSIIAEGSAKAQAIGAETVAAVKSAMHLNLYK